MFKGGFLANHTTSDGNRPQSFACSESELHGCLSVGPQIEFSSISRDETTLLFVSLGISAKKIRESGQIKETCSQWAANRLSWHIFECNKEFVLNRSQSQEHTLLLRAVRNASDSNALPEANARAPWQKRSVRRLKPAVASHAHSAEQS